MLKVCETNAHSTAIKTLMTRLLYILRPSMTLYSFLQTSTNLRLIAMIPYASDSTALKNLVLTQITSINIGQFLPYILLQNVL